ncbi:uncharacterized protein LOC105692808 isoform X2 [Athalia rosae]|nr:uncharacterized protein LOC105692808 isoform X2 [Athalia rosae]XP_012267687.2 uncharacterized protein LOC105692808 isoform X2 [Athalia rosae]XP_020711943.2 uncharacterized protein LOC105692808 isoform X2 [Athalia rosae]XP_048515229.1 uncharacterized protein LOC105692808 isoform X2 [Athalia rosae]
MSTSSQDWLDALYMQNVLRNYENDDSIEVSEIIVKPATAKGDNYGSEIYRVAVQFSRIKNGTKIDEEKSFIAKVALRLHAEMMMEVFVAELSLLHKILPKMNKIVEEFYPNGTPMSPRCLHVQYETPCHAILEDLATLGFRMADRRSGLDLDHALLTMRNLGKFHASSIALMEKEPGVLANYRKGTFHKDQPVVSMMLSSSLKSLATEVAKWPELSPRIAEKIQNISEVIFQRACEACEYTEGDFIILNHGDFWVNNMMFHYDEREKPDDQILLDFQVSHLGSPAEDIIHFFNTSITEDVRIHHLDLLIREYHFSLVSTMNRFNCKTAPASLENLNSALKKREICGVAVSMAIYPIMIMEKGVEVDLSDVLQTKFDNPAHRGELFRKVMARLLPIYDSNGLLD